MDRETPPYVRGGGWVRLREETAVFALGPQGVDEVSELLQDALALRAWGRECRLAVTGGGAP